MIGRRRGGTASKARAAVTAEYDREAERYDRRWRPYVEQTLDETLARLPDAPPRRLLDVGCGTGQLLAAIAADHPRTALSGVDLSDAMLAQARRRQPSYVQLHRASANALPFADHAFDQIVSVSALHCLPDVTTVLTECYRVLAPGGQLLAVDWCRDALTCRLLCVYLRARGIYARALTTGEIGTRARQAGFEQIHIERFSIKPRWAMMALRASRPA